MTIKHDFIFGMGSGHLNAKAAAIAKKHGARLVNHVSRRNGRKRHWFACENLGNPHDQNRARTILEEIAAGA